jgi:hypothetical protein
MSSPTLTADGVPFSQDSYNFAGFPLTLEQVDTEKDAPADTSEAPTLLEEHLHIRYPYMFPYGGDPDPNAADLDILGDLVGYFLAHGHRLTYYL